MFKLITTFFFLSTFTIYGQFSQLRVYSTLFDKDTCFSISIYLTNDTVPIYEEQFKDYSEIDIDSLKPGLYKIDVFNLKGQDEPYLTKYVSLFLNKTTIVSIDLNTDIEYKKFDTITRNTIYKQRQESEVYLSFLRNDWITPTPFIKYSGSLGFTQYYWSSFSKHFGILGGGGLGFSHHFISNDTSFINAPQFKKIYENYTYLDAHIALKLRVSTGNQQKGFHSSPKFLIDIGGIYYLPITFKHIVRYEGGKKISNNGLHQFTDFRAFINVGYSQVTFFCEYRLVDFIISGYPELPKFNSGIRLLIGH